MSAVKIVAIALIISRSIGAVLWQFQLYTGNPGSQVRPAGTVG